MGWNTMRIIAKEEKKHNFPLFASSHSPGRQRSETRGNLPAGKSSPHQEKTTGISPADAIFWATSCLGFIPPTAVKLGPTEMDRKREKKPGTTESSQGVAVTVAHSGLCYGQTSRFCRCRKRQEASQLLRAPQISAGTLVHSYSCSRMPAASVPLPSLLQSAQGAVQDGSLDCPPMADATAAGMLEVSSSSDVLARCCPATHHQPPLPRGEQWTQEMMPTVRVSAVAGLWAWIRSCLLCRWPAQPCSSGTIPVAAHWHSPSLTRHHPPPQCLYSRGDCAAMRKHPNSQGPWSCRWTCSWPWPLLPACPLHTQASQLALQPSVPCQSQPPPLPVPAAGCWTWKCSWRPQQPLGKPCSVCWGPHSRGILVTGVKVVTHPLDPGLPHAPVFGALNH